MRAIVLRRLLLWSVLAVILGVLALAMVIVWTANERQWFIDSAGVSATLDMTLSNTGRWVATGVLGVLILLVVLAFVVELATANAARGARRAGPLLPSLEERTVPRSLTVGATGPREAEEHPTEQMSLPRYQSTIVGNETARRMERSLPSSEQPDHSASEQAAVRQQGSAPTTRVDDQERTEARHKADDDAGAWRRTTVRLRPSGRR